MWPIFLDALRRRLIRWMVPGKRPRSRLVLTAVEPRIDFHRVPRGSFFFGGQGSIVLVRSHFGSIPSESQLG